MSNEAKDVLTSVIESLVEKVNDIHSYYSDLVYVGLIAQDDVAKKVYEATDPYREAVLAIEKILEEE